MKEFDKIYVSWRKGQGHRRYIVGVLQQSVTGTYSFTYDGDVIEKAKKDGFAH